MKRNGKKLFLRRLVGGVSHHINKSLFYLLHKHEYIKLYYSDNIQKPLLITPFCVELGENVNIWYNARIQGIKKYNNEDFSPHIIIRDGVSIQQNIHLTCASCIDIGANTAIAANVTITDIHHPYDDISIPIEKQDIKVSPVKIGKDCKIYNNAVILPGTVIGNHVTIGANSLVSGKIPDYTVVVGTPAFIIKRYDESNKTWRRTNKNGDFI